jgi:GDP-4-dehydro-6-deoxy-D-mannose reductase
MMLPDWVRQFASRHTGAASQRAPIRVHNLSTTLDLSDVRDVVRAYRLLMLQGESGEVYNVGSGVAVQSGQVFRILQEMTGEARQAIELYPGPNDNLIADISRLTGRTGWQPQYDLRQTVADTLRFWQQYELE